MSYAKVMDLLLRMAVVPEYQADMKTSQPRHGRYFVYMVRCGDGTYYTGSTANIEARLKLHNVVVGGSGLYI